MRKTQPKQQEDSDAEPAGTVQSVVVAVRILEALALSGEPMRVTELANALGESKARVHRHLTTLKSLALVSQERSTERYHLGWKLFQLGQAAAAQFDLRKLAEPFMARLRDATQQSVILAVPANGEVLVIASIESENKVNITVKPGNQPPAHCSAQGRLALAYAAPEVQKRALAGKLATFTPHSIVDRRALAERLALVRERLFETAPSEVMLGINTLAAPLFNPEGVLVGTVGIVGSVQHVPEPPEPQQVALVQQAAAGICRALGSDVYERRGLGPPRAAAVIG